VIEFIKESDEVFYPDENLVVVGNKELDKLKQLALCNDRQRARLCTHNSPESKLHEMFIVHAKECYVRPHKHVGKDESISILEGEADVVMFDDDGEINQVINTTVSNSSKAFYCRIPDSIYHMLIIRTEFLVFYECTQGPFIRDDTVFPEWAPLDEDPENENFIRKVESYILNRD